MGHGAAALSTLPENLAYEDAFSAVSVSTTNRPLTAPTVDEPTQARPTAIGARHQALGRHQTGRMFSRTRTPDWWRPVMVAYSTLVIIAIVIVKLGLLSAASQSPILSIYGLLVGAYLTSNIVLALKYRAEDPISDIDVLPSIAVIVPAYNEPAGSVATIESILTCDYPASKLRVIVVDDGSSDGTWDAIAACAATDSRVTALRMERNGGKRAAMANGYRALSGQPVVVFVDSDTLLERTSLRALVTPLITRPNVAVVTGHADVANPGESWLARLQQVRYYAAFRLVKGAESVTRKVTCASGCFSAYRVSVLDELMDDWLGQMFLGQRATYGDDRALSTNTLAAGYDIVYQENAVCWTNVPTRWKVFWKQQLRWKKSWTRESLRLIPFAWRLGVIPGTRAYVSILLQLIGPLVVTYSLVVRPFENGAPAWLYLAGIQAMATLYGLFYGVMRRQSSWWPGVVYAVMYTIVMSWQVYLAMFKLKDTSWGTRTSDTGQDDDDIPGIAERVDGSGRGFIPRSPTAPQEAQHWGIGLMAVPLTALPLVLCLIWFFTAASGQAL